MKPTKERIFESLNNALVNGDFEPGGELHGATAGEIALDMMMFDADCGDCEEGDILAFVSDWLDALAETGGEDEAP